MKTFFAATAAVALATSLVMAACTSDDSSPPAETIANVPSGGACTQTTQCADGLECGYAVSTAGCSAGDAGATCVAIANCTVHTWCPCGGGPAFSECSNGTAVSQPSFLCDDGGTTGDGAAPELDGAVDAANLDAHSDAPIVVDAGSDTGTDAATDANPDASDAAHD